MAFSGWPEEALDFYDGLAADNSKTYWTRHKAVYEDTVRRPMAELIDELADEFGRADSEPDEPGLQPVGPRRPAQEGGHHMQDLRATGRSAAGIVDDVVGLALDCVRYPDGRHFHRCDL